MFLRMGRVEPFLKDFLHELPRSSCTTPDARCEDEGRCSAWRSACTPNAMSGSTTLRSRCQALGCPEHQVNEVLAIIAINYTYNTFFKFRDLSG